jgi:hypothetical protein
VNGFESGVATYLDDFLRLQLLYWVEVLSLIEEMPFALLALQSSAEWASVSGCFL